MSSSDALEWVLAAIPSGHPDPASTFNLQPIASPLSAATPGHMLLRLKVVAVDPYIRVALPYATVGAVQESFCVAEVVDSQLEGYAAGELVTGVLPWRTIQLSNGKFTFGTERPLKKITTLPGVPLSAWVGVLGLPGQTAYFGLLDSEMGGLKAGQTVVVSGAAGAVGSVVGQLARLKGAKRVIGTAGGPAKCKVVTAKYGYDECLDYKVLDTVDKMQAALKAAVPDKVNVYFDNVGGAVTQAMWPLYAQSGI